MTTAAVPIDSSELADRIVQTLEQAQAKLELAEQEARRLAEATEPPGFTPARFRYPVYVEAHGLADDLSGESGSEFDLELVLRDARELKQLIALARETG